MPAGWVRGACARYQKSPRNPRSRLSPSRSQSTESFQASSNRHHRSFPYTQESWRLPPRKCCDNSSPLRQAQRARKPLYDNKNQQNHERTKPRESFGCRRFRSVVRLAVAGLRSIGNLASTRCHGANWDAAYVACRLRRVSSRTYARYVQRQQLTRWTNVRSAFSNSATRPQMGRHRKCYATSRSIAGVFPATANCRSTTYSTRSLHASEPLARALCATGCKPVNMCGPVDRIAAGV
jgi:hypothetical protein